MRMVTAAALSGLLLLLFTTALGAVDTEDSAAEDSGAAEESSILYIVYLGGKGDKHSDELVQIHNNMLGAVTNSAAEKPPEIVYNYKHGFSGFAARMTAKQAASFAEMPEVVSVFRSKILKLHTTHSWDYLKLALPSLEQHTEGSHDVIVGMLDTGIWPESASFSDAGMSSPPARWKGLCNNTGLNSSESVTCSNKIIGARAYSSAEFFSAAGGTLAASARDDQGHGTHTASTAAGSVVYNASMSGVASGIARGGLPTARLAIYKVCGSFGCFESDIMKACDDAIGDGVDMMSLSLGGAPEEYDQDGIAIAAFHAIEHNITVICSAGNSGPDEETASNTAPWIVTVAASTMNRTIAASISLGNSVTLQGTALSFRAQKNPPYPLISGASIPANKSSLSTDASNCIPDSLNSNKVKNHIVVCQFDPQTTTRRSIITWFQKYNAAGAILINDFYADLASYFPFPTTIVKTSVGHKLFKYMNSTSSPVATLHPTKADTTSPAPVVAGFSSRGPNSISPDILKPDLTAPGVNVLAAWSPKSPAYDEDYNFDKPVFVNYNIISGTSMSCPHVTGATAYLKSYHPDWSPAALKSALMTTATVHDNLGQEITDYNGHSSNPFGYGSGQINPVQAVSPGLVYDITPSDYIAYLCATGYDSSKIGIITGHKNISCSKKTASLNYPSVAFPNLSGTSSTTRKLTSVDNSPSTYVINVTSSSTLSVTVEPTSLTFSGYGSTQSYTITVSTSSSSKSWQFASLSWSDGKHSVRSPIAVKQK